MGSELQARTPFRTDCQPALEFSMGAITLASEEVGGGDLPPLPSPTAAGAQELSSWDGKTASQSTPGRQMRRHRSGDTRYLADALALHRQHLHLGEVVVKGHHVGDDGFLIGVFCEDICKGEGCSQG